ncbi:MAG: DUF3817 domain-containing protein [Opitutales bacterium]
MQTFHQFRRIAFTEAVSYLLLLLVAMPLKYGLGMDWVVSVVGWAHGVLFILYGVWLVLCWQRYAWPLKTVVLAAVASLVPAGPFYMDPRLPRPDEATAARPAA